jgi:hypothetical protein
VAGHAGAPYEPGLLGLREGALLEAAVRGGCCSAAAGEAAVKGVLERIQLVLELHLPLV